MTDAPAQVVEAETFQPGTLPPEPKATNLVGCRPWCSQIVASFAGKSSLSIGDQAFISGTNFLTTIVIGRICGPRELGMYSLGFTLVVLMLAAQHALIVVPYTIYYRRLPEAGRAEYAGAVLVHHFILSGVMMIGLALAGIVLRVGVGSREFNGLVWALTAAVPFLLLREFGRRFAFAHLHVERALLLDAAVAAMQIAGLILLAAGGTLSAGTSYMVSGFGCAVFASVWLKLNRSCFVVRGGRIASEFQRNWSFGKWVFADHLATAVSTYLNHWLLMIMLGTMATGTFAACMSIVLLTNPFVAGMNNVFMPKTAQAFAEGGLAATRSFLRRATLIMVTGTGVFFIFVLFFGDPLMSLLYGSKYAGQGHTLKVLAVDAVVCALSAGPGYGLWVLERSDIQFVAKLLRIAATLSVSVSLVTSFGVLGAAYGMLIGDAVGVIAIYLFHRRSLAAASRRLLAPSAIVAQAEL